MVVALCVSDPAAMAAKMGHAIDKNRQLSGTNLPLETATVRLVDEARRRDRQMVREWKNENEFGNTSNLAL